MLGNYDLVELMGRGGMGEVWHAVERDTMRPRAIKVLSPDIARRTSGVANLRREGEIGMQLAKHDWIVTVHGVHETLLGDPACPERVVYLVMDLVDGVNLRQFAERYYRTMSERLPIRVVVHIIRAVLRALDAAHTKAIGGTALTVVHGDINPGNVLISSHGEIRVTDFGISRFAPETSFVSRPIGTLPYMAPEQYRGVVRPQNDLYAVGAVIHELLAGSPPLAEGGGPITLERKLLQEPVPPLGREDVPAAFERLRRGLLEKNADLRIPTADKALEILAEVDERDCLREIRIAYRRMFGPPRSRMTRYLTTQGVGTDSFVMELIFRHEQALGAQTSQIVSVDAATRAGPPSDAPKAELAAKDGADDDVPWLADDEDAIKTQEHHRSGPRPNPTTHLELPGGNAVPLEDTPPTTATSAASLPAALEPVADDSARVEALPLLDPVDGEDIEAANTTPHRAAARTVSRPEPHPRRFPPRPPHLEDGVPFQRHRPKRSPDNLSAPAEGREPEASASAGVVEVGTVTGADMRPHQTRPERSPETRPDLLPTAPPIPRRRPLTSPTTRWIRSTFMVVTVLLLVACGIGIVGLVLTEAEHAIASPHNNRQAAATATTDG